MHQALGPEQAGGDGGEGISKKNMYLNKKQLKFLKSIPENGDIEPDDMTDEQFKIAVFLEKEGLVNAKREIIHTKLV